MRVLSAIVQVSALTVLDIWQKLALGYAGAPQFVGDENARHVLQPLQETLEEALRRSDSGDFSPGRGGLLQLLSMSLSPCCRFHPAKVSSRIGQISAVHVAFALRLQARPSEIFTFEATMRSLLLRPGDS
jgi:hypothetical protein